MKIVVLDIGGTAIKAGLFDGKSLIGVKEVPTLAFKGGPYIVETCIELIRSYDNFERIGISTAGMVDECSGRILYANSNIPNYTGVELKKIMEATFHVPTVVENDVNCAAIGEGTYGAAKAYQDYLCLTYGTGVGGAIVMNRKVFKGCRHAAGEFGAIVCDPTSWCADGDPYNGGYERLASTSALVSMAREYDKDLDNGRKIFARKEESEVAAIIDKWMDQVVIGLASLVYIFDPPCIVLGGGVMSQKYIIDNIMEKLYNKVNSVYRNIHIVQAQLGNTAGLLGAAKLAHDIQENTVETRS